MRWGSRTFLVGDYEIHGSLGLHPESLIDQATVDIAWGLYPQAAVAGVPGHNSRGTGCRASLATYLVGIAGLLSLQAPVIELSDKAAYSTFTLANPLDGHLPAQFADSDLAKQGLEPLWEP